MPFARGRSGNPGGQWSGKPFRDALRMEEKELEKGIVTKHPKGSLRWNAQKLLLEGSHQSIKEVADRLDGRPAQAIVGGDEGDPALQISEIRHTIVDHRRSDDQD
jgi:hypothetical protein